ncbi:MAG TPA: PQQ-binding-like beta-propeller repeat protein [Phycisphaerae bacterium]|nr:PQQ-binding-like beta-propeller repeat protein [Phycisphaerae bacterium]
MLALTPPRAVGFQQVFRGQPRVMAAALLPLSDRDAENWLKRAEEASARGDWKLAADTLARVIDQYGDKTVSMDEGKHFYSASRCALDQIGQWPEEGLATYRLLFDGEVRHRLERAIKGHQLDELRHIARKFPYTTPAPEAMNLLAAWLLDRRQAGEALDILHKLSALPRHTIPQEQILTKYCVAYALTGQKEAAERALTQLRELESSAAGAVSTDGPSRVRTLEAFLKSADEPLARGPEASGAWPIIGGPPSRGGQMPAIDPAFAPEDSWHDRLPGSERIQSRRIGRLIKTTSRPPVWQAVSDGRFLFVTCPEGLIARDLATFDFMWRIVPRSRARDTAVSQFRQRVGTETDNRDKLDELSTRTLWHDYRGAVSTAYGLVFTIEQSGTSGEVFPSRQGIISPDEFGMGVVPEPNSIRAFEADTGRAVWTKGRSGPVADELRAAHFYSVPVPLDAEGSHENADRPRLIAPYQLGDDYFLAVFRTDGSLIKSVLLGSGYSGLFPINAVLQPTVCDGAVYVPTGAGLLVALNADDLSLRWLTSYERAGASRQLWTDARRGLSVTAAPADEWLSSPAIIAGGLVLVAAPDSEYLVAYNQEDGQAKWSYPRGTLRYLVAADSRRAIVAGKYVIAIEVATGNVEWMFDRKPSTGRPAWAGDAVFVPTEDGLVRLDVRTGKEIGDPLSTRFALGNLLSIDGGLYSVTATDVTKFPDVDQSRLMAHQSLQRDPNDVGAMLRLAWLAVIEKQWDKAIDLLDRAEARVQVRSSATTQPAEGAGSATSELLARIARQRVTVLLRVAAESGDEANRTPDPGAPGRPLRGRLADRSRASLLDEAVRSAQQPSDLIRAGMALCELLAEQKKPAEAFRRVLELVRTVGDEPVALEPQLSATAAVLFRERLCGWWRAMSPSDRTQAAEDTRRLIESNLAGGEWSALAALADVLDLRPSGEDVGAMMPHAAWLDLQLGHRSLAGGDYESGYFYLERAAERNPRSDVAAEAMIRLAVVYSNPGEDLPAAPREALRVVTALEELGLARPLPEASRDVVGAAGRTISDAIVEIRKLLPRSMISQENNLPDVLRDTPKLTLAADTTVPAGLRPDVMAFHDPARPIDLFEQTFPIYMARQIRGLRYSADVPDRYFWAVDDDTPDGQGGWITNDRAFEETAQPATISNRVAVLAAHDSIFAVGLTTGQILWPPIAVTAEDESPPNPRVLSVGGMFVIAPDSSTLIGVAARACAGPSWRRRFVGPRIAQLAVVGQLIVAVDSAGDIVTVLDPVGGRVQRQFSMLPGAGGETREPVKESDTAKEARTDSVKTARRSRQGQNNVFQWLNRRRGEEEPEVDAAEPTVQHVSIVGSSVCRALSDHVIAKDITSGRMLWNTPMGGLVGGVVPFTSTRVGVYYAGTHIAILDAASGVVVKDIHTEGLRMPPLDATLDAASGSGDAQSASAVDAGRLLLFTQTTDDPPHYVLASFPLGEGQQPWRRDLGRLSTVNRRMLRASPDYVAFIEYFMVQETANLQQVRAFVRTGNVMNSPYVQVIDKRNNRSLLEESFSLNEHRPTDLPSGSNLITDVIVLNERIVAVGPDGYYVLAAETKPGGAEATGEEN